MHSQGSVPSLHPRMLATFPRVVLKASQSSGCCSALSFVHMLFCPTAFVWLTHGTWTSPSPSPVGHRPLGVPRRRRHGTWRSPSPSSVGHHPLKPQSRRRSHLLYLSCPWCTPLSAVAVEPSAAQDITSPAAPAIGGRRPEKTGSSCAPLLVHCPPQ